MNWTHRFTLDGWDDWYLIDIMEPVTVVNERLPDSLLSVYNSWFEEIKKEKSFQIEELNISLENE